MTEFFSSVYGWIASIAGGVAVLWGLLKAIGALRQWVKKRIDQIKQRNDLPAKLYTMIDEINTKIQKTNDCLENVQQKINLVNERLDQNDEATATLMLEKMMWAYHYYVLQGHEISLDTRTALTVMFDQYKKNKKHNHVPDDFKTRIMQCRVVGSK